MQDALSSPYSINLVLFVNQINNTNNDSNQSDNGIDVRRVKHGFSHSPFPLIKNDKGPSLSQNNTCLNGDRGLNLYGFPLPALPQRTYCRQCALQELYYKIDILATDIPNHVETVCLQGTTKGKHEYQINGGMQ